MRRVTTLIVSTALAVLPGCSHLMLRGDERGGALVGKVAARSLLGLMTVGMSEAPYACVRDELSTIPKSDHAVRRDEAWRTCQQRLNEGRATGIFTNPALTTWRDLERQRRDDAKRRVLLHVWQQQSQQRYQQQLMQQQLLRQQQPYLQRLYQPSLPYQPRMLR